MELNQLLLNEFIFNLKNNKYKGIIHELTLEYCSSEQNVHYIYLGLINIKKSHRNKGYGNAIMSEIIKLADKYNVHIKLWVTDIYGSNFKRLVAFYQRHGFTIMKDVMNTQMDYKPQKTKHKKTNSLNAPTVIKTHVIDFN